MNDREEVYLTAKEAVEYGFADYVFGEDGTYDWKSLREFKD
jgi:ATP-dependent protease ClpP protease subunit